MANGDMNSEFVQASLKTFIELHETTRNPIYAEIIRKENIYARKGPRVEVRRACDVAGSCAGP